MNTHCCYRQPRHCNSSDKAVFWTNANTVQIRVFTPLKQRVPRVLSPQTEHPGRVGDHSVVTTNKNSDSSESTPPYVTEWYSTKTRKKCSLYPYLFPLTCFCFLLSTFRFVSLILLLLSSCCFTSLPLLYLSLQQYTTPKTQQKVLRYFHSTITCDSKTSNTNYST